MSIEVVNTNAQELYNTVLQTVESGISEPLYPADERRILTESLILVLVQTYNAINESAKQVMLTYASGEVLDELGARLNVSRIAATKATCTMRFYSAGGKQITVPSGTRVTGDGVKYFYTVDDTIISTTDTYADIKVEATEGGSEYNGYLPKTITTLCDVIGYITKVENITETANGDDGEPYNESGDNHFRERIKLAPATLSNAGTRSSYEYFTKSASSRVIDVAITTPSAGEVNIYPLMENGELPTEEEIQAISEVVMADDVRCMTDLVSVKAPTAIEYDIEVDYYTTANDEVAIVESIESKGGAIDEYISWQCSELGQAINPDMLRKFMLSPTGGVGAVRLTITSPTYVELEENEVAKFSGNLTITHKVVSK